MTMAVQLIGYILSICGLFVLIVATFTNEWKVIEQDNEDVTFMDIIEGLWMKCSIDSSSQVKCISYNSFLHPSVEIRVGRAMMILSIALSGIGVFLGLAGLSCTKCLDGEDRLKDKVSFTGGCLFILSGFCALATTSWFIYEIVADFQEETQGNRKDIGRSLFAGFIAAFLCVFGGVLLCICSATHLRSSANVSKPPKFKNPDKDYV
ncbi:claudin-1 [Paramisgurnus dabryanus]|uniref:claudin-1 n=1 Tax=Paramisgurnus dabryanus TaxID=90735 RepID=UPI0031F345F7